MVEVIVYVFDWEFSTWADLACRQLNLLFLLLFLFLFLFIALLLLLSLPLPLFLPIFLLYFLNPRTNITQNILIFFYRLYSITALMKASITWITINNTITLLISGWETYLAISFKKLIWIIIIVIVRRNGLRIFWSFCC